MPFQTSPSHLNLQHQIDTKLTCTHSKQFLRSVSWVPSQSGLSDPIWLYTVRTGNNRKLNVLEDWKGRIRRCRGGVGVVTGMEDYTMLWWIQWREVASEGRMSDWDDRTGRCEVLQEMVRNTVLSSIFWYNVMQYSAVQFRAVSTLQYNTIHHRAD